MPTFSVYIATNPFGRVMQVWGTPLDMFTELIATDYPDPDTCTTTLVISTPSYSEAVSAFDIQARVLRTYANAYGVQVHAINPHLES